MKKTDSVFRVLLLTAVLFSALNTGPARAREAAKKCSAHAHFAAHAVSARDGADADQVLVTHCNNSELTQIVPVHPPAPALHSSCINCRS